MEVPQRPEIARHKEPRTREPLSDAEMGNLISAFGNHEAKAMILIGMRTGTIYTRQDLHRQIMELQGQRKGWRMNRNGPFNYCKNSLSPIGLVTQEVIDPDLSTWGYIKTEYGEKTGVPLAGLLLKFSQEHPEYSLWDFFSQTASSSKQVTTEEVEAKKRAPITRFKILWELATSDLPIRQADLVKQLGVHYSIIAHHLINLKNNALISYEAAEQAEPFSFYKLFPTHPQEQPAKFQDMPNLTTFVYQAFLEHPDTEWTRDSMADFYLKKTQKQIDMTHISQVFSRLQKAGYAKRRKFSKERQSEIDLTPGQRKTIVDLVTILDRFQNQDPEVIREGRDFANFLLSHPEVVSQLFLKAREHSPNANQMAIEETEQMILKILSSSQPLSNKEIAHILKDRHNGYLSTHSISEFTHSLSQQGRISVSEEKGGINKYSLLGIAAPDRM